MKKMLIIALMGLLVFACAKKENTAGKKETKQEVESADMQTRSEEIVEEKVVEAPAQPIVAKPIAEKPVAEKSVAEKSVVKKPVVKKAKEETEPDSENYKMSEAELWEAYKSSKDNLAVAKEENNYSNIEKYLLETAKYSNILERIDIEAWQYNNLGFYLIENYKSETNYMAATAKLNSMVAGAERNQYRAEIKGKFLQHKDLLTRAEKYLKKATELDESLEESSRTTTIKSNIMFVNQVLDFIS